MRHPRRPAYIMAAAVIATGMAFIDTTALNVALDRIREDLNASNAQLLWTLNAYALSLAALLLAAGSFSDRLGHRLAFAIGVISFALNSLACGLAPSIEWLIAFRVLQGAGAAFMIPGSLILICDTYPPEQRGKAIGLWTGCSVLMMTLGPIIGGILADQGSWRMIFFLNLPLSAAVIWCLRQDGESEVRPTNTEIRTDWTGMILAAASLSLISYGFLRMATSRGSLVAVSVVAGLVLLAGFIWHETRFSHPMLPVTLIRKPQVMGACLIMLLIYTAFHAMLVFIPLRLIQIDRMSALGAGVAQLPTLGCLIMISPLAGAVFDRCGAKVSLIPGIACGAAGFALLGLLANTTSYWTRWFPGLTALGVGLSFSITSLGTLLMNSVSPERLGIASSLNSAVSRLASVIGIAVLCGIGFGILGKEFDQDPAVAFSSTNIQSPEYHLAFEKMFTTISFAAATIVASCLAVATWFLRRPAEIQTP